MTSGGGGRHFWSTTDETQLQNRRPDLWANLIGCNQHGHRGKHDGTRGERNRFVVLALMAKWRKQDSEEFWLHKPEGIDDWNYAELIRTG